MQFSKAKSLILPRSKNHWSGNSRAFGPKPRSVSVFRVIMRDRSVKRVRSDVVLGQDGDLVILSPKIQADFYIFQSVSTIHVVYSCIYLKFTILQLFYDLVNNN